MKNKILALGLVLALVAVMVMPMATLAAQPTTDTVTGSFITGSNIPAVTVKLYNAAGTTEVTSITPYSDYTVRVHVTDADGLTNMNTITVKMWYDNNGGTPTDGEFDAFTTAGAQTGIIYTWTESSGSFVFTEDAGSTWADGASVQAAADLSNDFQFKFTVGKVANQTTGSDSWQIGAKVVDKDPNTVYAYDSDTNTMDSYREVIVTATTVSWGTLTAGQVFAEGDPDEENVGNIQYISNGAYSKKVSTGNWTASAATATLDEDGGTLAANNFSLKADDTGTLSSAVYVTTAGAIIGTGSNAGEAGTTDATNGLWIQLASTFAGGTFSGTITYTIQ